MTLSDEIRKLTQNMLEGHESRTAAVAGIRTSTAQELAEFHAAHQAQAAEQRQRLAEDRDRLASDTAAFMDETHAANRRMAAELRAHLDEQELARREQAAEDARGRAEDVAALKSDTAAFMDETHSATRQMAAELRAHLDEQESARQEQAAEDARERAEYVAALKSNTAAMLNDLQAEFDKARGVWSSFNRQRQVQQRRGRVGRPVAAPPPVKEAPPTEEAEAAADDLTVIRGIGTTMQHRLNEAGFYTYAQLTKAIPKELRQALGEVGPRAKLEEWIEEARELLE